MPSNGSRSPLRKTLFAALVVSGYLSLFPAGRADGAVRALWAEAEILCDLVEEYKSAEIQNSPESAVGDIRGNRPFNYSLLKRYLFLHPPSGETTAASAAYSIALPKLGKEERLLFLSAVGLRPGWKDADREAADGVIFRVLVDGEKALEEAWDRDGWLYVALDLSKQADRKIRLTLVCDRNRNSSADWALWGDPRVVVVRPVPESRGAPSQPNFLLFQIPPSQEVQADWPALGARGSGAIKRGGKSPEGALAWFPALPSGEGPPRLPQMKLPDGSSPTPSNVSLVSYSPKVEVASISQSSAIISPNELFNIIATFRNVGEGALVPGHRFEVRLGVHRAFGFPSAQRATQILDELKPGEERVLAWRVAAPASPGKFQFALRIGLAALKTFDVVVSPTGKGIDYGHVGPDPGGFHEREDSIVLEKGINRLAFVRSGGRFLYGAVLLKDAERWSLVGRLAPFAELSIKLRDGSTQKVEIQPSRHARLDSIGGRPIASDELGILLSDDFADNDSVRWHFEQSFTIENGAPWMDVETALTADAPTEVLSFIAPKLLAGDGSFGRSKDQALFPGLEYLGKDEPSSSTRDIAFPQSRRFTPHPLRVTIPLVAVRKGNTVLGLAWDVHQKWYEERQMPSPLFSSPNVLPVQDNHLMAILVPPVPEFVEEGTMNSRRALSIAPKQALRTKASILLMANTTDVTDAPVAWVQKHGLPDLKPPRTFDDEVTLCRHGFLQSVWNESAQGWSHCVGWQAGPFPGYCTLLNMDSFLTQNDETRQALHQRTELVIRNCLSRYGAGSLWRPDGCHILTGELPFLAGQVFESVESWENAISGLVANQSPDGSWRWRPDEKQSRLGKPGDTTSGMSARGACQALREAIVTGNRKHIEAGFKALNLLDSHKIPTGAQEWECPIYAPDVLAAAYAVRAFVHAYEITGEDRYLEKAKFWAKTGIPFIYLWDRGEDMPQMRYAGIPIFGATFYTHSWLGRPVQWCSLVYAYSLIRLAQYDNSFDWRRLAEGITVSAMWQQYAEGKSKGCYPDSWDLIENHPNPADLNPENILVNLLALNGYDPGLKHGVLNRKGNPIFVSSVAEIVTAQMVGRDTINLRLKFFPGIKSYVLVAGLSSPFKPEVFLNGKRLPSTEEIDRASAGYFYDASKGWLVIALTHTKEGDALQIQSES